jgi:AcrR family transcriptional regulator
VPTPTTRSDSAAPVKRSPRERLLDAANELFYAEGVQSVGIDRVIERAGVAKASLYSTFGSKEELVRAYLEARHERTLGRLRAAARALVAAALAR